MNFAWLKNQDFDYQQGKRLSLLQTMSKTLGVPQPPVQ